MKKLMALVLAIFLSGFMSVTVYAAPNDSQGNQQSGNVKKQQAKQKEKLSKPSREMGNYAKRNNLRREMTERKKKRQELINSAKTTEQNRK